MSLDVACEGKPAEPVGGDGDPGEALVALIPVGTADGNGGSK